MCVTGDGDGDFQDEAGKVFLGNLDLEHDAW